MQTRLVPLQNMQSYHKIVTDLQTTVCCGIDKQTECIERLQNQAGFKNILYFYSFMCTSYLEIVYHNYYTQGYTPLQGYGNKTSPFDAQDLLNLKRNILVV